MPVRLVHPFVLWPYDDVTPRKTPTLALPHFDEVELIPRTLCGYECVANAAQLLQAGRTQQAAEGRTVPVEVLPLNRAYYHCRSARRELADIGHGSLAFW